jgi:hypothetical protein
MECWKCHREIDVGRKIMFRAACPLCGFDLHVCKNCRFYAPGKPNDCAFPGTEYVRDREAANFCEEFAVKTPAGPGTDDPLKKAKELFGEDLPKKKNPFKDD